MMPGVPGESSGDKRPKSHDDLKGCLLAIGRVLASGMAIVLLLVVVLFGLFVGFCGFP